MTDEARAVGTVISPMVGREDAADIIGRVREEFSKDAPCDIIVLAVPFGSGGEVLEGAKESLERPQ